MASPDAPRVFSIQHFCLHDGPGIRSVVFFKGCPLRCAWCQNPESWSPGPEVAFRQSLCISCGRCAAACPMGGGTRAVYRDPALCRKCLRCVDACPSGALTGLGAPATVDGLVRGLSSEFPLHRDSGGGVTLSGGEPGLYPEFCAALAKSLHVKKISIAMETSGMVQPGALKLLLREIDLMLFDIKLFSDREHRGRCGAGNDTIKKNLMDCARSGGAKLWPRMPLVPGVTGARQNVLSWAGLLRGNGIRAVTVVPYHRMGNDKRLWLGMEPAPEFAVPTEGDIWAAMEIFRKRGVAPFLPGEEDWDMIGVSRAPLGGRARRGKARPRE